MNFTVLTHLIKHDNVMGVSDGRSLDQHFREVTPELRTD